MKIREFIPLRTQYKIFVFTRCNTANKSAEMLYDLYGKMSNTSECIVYKI